jgi:hypothetical protein
MKINKLRKGIGILVLFLVLPFLAYAFEPSAPNDIVNVSTESPTPAAGYMLNNSGGIITTLNINATTQNYRWKGFVGNISGQLALLDSSLSSLYSWDFTTITGEIYATRNSSIVDWDSIACASGPIISAEQTALNITTSSIDSINNTFNGATHDEFYSGMTQISSDSCPATALNVNNTEQSTDFQEILLTDGSSLIYSSVLENSTYGFDNQTYDFQMIVAENALEGSQPNTPYYFYVELI